MKNESTFSGSFIVVFPIIDGWHNELTLFSSLSIHDYGKSLQIFIWFDLFIFNQWGSGRLVADRYLKVLVLGHFHFFGLPKTLYTCTLNKACLCSTQRKISVNRQSQSAKTIRQKVKPILKQLTSANMLADENLWNNHAMDPRPKR